MCEQVNQVTVSGKWLKACGKGDQDRAFQVTRIQTTSAPKGSGFEVMFHVDDNGHPWTVALCRLAVRP